MRARSARVAWIAGRQHGRVTRAQLLAAGIDRSRIGRWVADGRLHWRPAWDLRSLARACHEAWVRHRTAPRQVESCIARNPHKPGAAKLRRALGADVTLSALEDGFLALLRTPG